MFNTSTRLSESKACICTFKHPLAPLAMAPSTQHPAAVCRSPQRCCSAVQSWAAGHVPRERTGRLRRGLGVGQKRPQRLAFWQARAGSSSLLALPADAAQPRASSPPCREAVPGIPEEPNPRDASSGLRSNFGCVLAGEPALFIAHPSKHY